MKSTVILGNATRAVGKLFFALTLLVVAVAAGFGGTALIVYHRLDGGRAPAVSVPAERKAAGLSRSTLPTTTKDDAKLRRVTALPSDQPQYTFADNNGGQPSVPARRERPTVSVPAPLENSAPSAEVSSAAIGLNDPESRYIVDSRTGRVVGVDGSAGARREDEAERQRLESMPRPVAAQTPVPEVRVASAVTEDGAPFYHDPLSIPVNESGNQFLPVRRALPVSAEAVSAEPRNFNVAEYMARGQSRPVLRAQPVVADASRGARTTRVYHLSDGSQSVASY